MGFCIGLDTSGLGARLEAGAHSFTRKMDLPDIQRGMAIMAEHIQKLVQEIRSNAITSVIGGQFNRTRSGTSIQIDPTTFGGGGGGTPEPYCQYKITDATSEGNLMVLVPYMIIAGKVPQGMVLGEDYKLNVGGTGRVYCSIKFDLETLNVATGEDAVTVFFSEGAPLENLEDTQYEVLATVIVTSGAISKITNRCTLPDENPCLLPWTVPPAP